jgi:hypothetical protein
MRGHFGVEIRKTFSPVTLAVLPAFVGCCDIKRLCETS